MKFARFARSLAVVPGEYQKCLPQDCLPAVANSKVEATHHQKCLPTPFILDILTHIDRRIIMKGKAFLLMG